MPIYQYRCQKCAKTFDREEPISEHDGAHPRCPECGSDQIEQVLTPFFARTAKKS